MWQQDVYRMIQRRAKAAGIKTRIGNHTFRATASRRNDGRLEDARQWRTISRRADDQALRQAR